MCEWTLACMIDCILIQNNSKNYITITNTTKLRYLREKMLLSAETWEDLKLNVGLSDEYIHARPAAKRHERLSTQMGRGSLARRKPRGATALSLSTPDLAAGPEGHAPQPSRQGPEADAAPRRLCTGSPGVCEPAAPQVVSLKIHTHSHFDSSVLNYMQTRLVF